MARKYVVLGDGREEGIAPGNTGGLVLVCLMIVLSLTLISMVIFACGSHKKKRRRSGNAGGGGGCGGGDAGGGCGGGCGGGGGG